MLRSMTRIHIDEILVRKADSVGGQRGIISSSMTSGDNRGSTSNRVLYEMVHINIFYKLQINT